MFWGNLMANIIIFLKNIIASLAVKKAVDVLASNLARKLRQLFACIKIDSDKVESFYNRFRSFLPHLFTVKKKTDYARKIEWSFRKKALQKNFIKACRSLRANLMALVFFKNRKFKRLVALTLIAVMAIQGMDSQIFEKFIDLFSFNAFAEDVYLDDSSPMPTYGWYLDNTSGGTKEAPYIIKNGSDLAGLARIVNGDAVALIPSSDQVLRDALTAKIVENKGESMTVDDFAGRYITVGPNSKGNTIELKWFGGSFNGDNFVITSEAGTYTTGWVPIGTSANPFRGSFDGRMDEGFVITKLAFDRSSGYAGLFGCLDYYGASADMGIKNVSLTDVQIKAQNNIQYVGALAGRVIGDNPTVATEAAIPFGVSPRISNIELSGRVGANFTVRAGDTGSPADYVGGIIGGANDILISDCSALNIKVVSAYSNTGNIGGILGLGTGNIYLQDCELSGSVTKPTFSSTSANLGGIVGNLSGLSATPAVALNCSVNKIDAETFSTVSSTGGAGQTGGFAGRISGAFVSNCTAMANVTSSGAYYGGGFVGYIDSSTAKSDFTNCSVVASSVSGSGYLGGFAGSFNDGTSLALNVPSLFDTCTVSLGTISNNDTFTGGFIGSTGQYGYPKFDVCTVVMAGDISSSASYVGGFAGSAPSGEFVDCSATGTNISCTSGELGGFIGVSNGTGAVGTLIQNCFANFATISGTDIVGGFLGNNNGVANADFVSCYSTANITGTGTSAGGFVGRTQRLIAGAGTLTTINYEYCYTKATTVSGGSYVGGFEGGIFTTASSNIMSTQYIRCYSAATVSGNGSGGHVGGFAGDLLYARLAYCYSASPTVSGQYAVGGFAGASTGFGVQFYNCFFTGDTVTSTTITPAVTNSATGVGGFLGYSITNTAFEKCFVANASVTDNGGNGASIFAGTLAGSASIESCFAAGSVKSNYGASTSIGVRAIGGLVGYFANPANTLAISNSYSSGSVETRGTFNSNSNYYSYTPGFAGGIIGAVNSGSGALSGLTISSSYHSGWVYGPSLTRMGGIIGGVTGSNVSSGVSINAAYYNSSLSGELSVQNGFESSLFADSAKTQAELSALSMPSGAFSISASNSPELSWAKNYSEPDTSRIAALGFVTKLTVTLGSEYAAIAKNCSALASCLVVSVGAEKIDRIRTGIGFAGAITLPVVSGVVSNSTADNVVWSQNSVVGVAAKMTPATGTNFTVVAATYGKIVFTPNISFTVLNEDNLSIPIHYYVPQTVSVDLLKYSDGSTVSFMPGSGTLLDPYQIRNVAEFKALRDNINYGSRMKAGEHFSLIPDASAQSGYNLTSEAWRPLGTIEYPFTGYFSGRNGEETSSVQNLKSDNTVSPAKDYHTGLFGYVADAAFSDLSLSVNYVNGGRNVGGFIGLADNITAQNITVNLLNGTNGTRYISGSSSIGGIVGRVSTYAKFDNCKLTKSTSDTKSAVLSSSQYIGGIVGAAGFPGDTVLLDVINSSVTVDTGNLLNPATSSAYAGGIVGFAHTSGGSKIQNCNVTGSIQTARNYIGGVAGYISNLQIKDTNVKMQSGASNLITGSTYIGGIVGQSVGTGNTIENCTSDGNITATSQRVGGIIGDLSGTAISDSKALGTITATSSYIGGIAGYISSQASSIVRTSFYGKAISSASYAGGLVGYAGAATTIDGCNVFADVSVLSASGVYAGGLAGYITATSSVIRNSYAVGTVTGYDHIGGLAGYQNQATITNSYASNLVSGSTNVGGISGELIGNGTIDRAYSSGELISVSLAGGIVGYFNAGNINDSYYDKQTTGAALPYSSLRVPALTSNIKISGISNVAGTSLFTDGFYSALPVLSAPASDGIYYIFASEKYPQLSNFAGESANAFNKYFSNASAVVYYDFTQRTSTIESDPENGYSFDTIFAFTDHNSSTVRVPNIIMSPDGSTTLPLNYNEDNTGAIKLRDNLDQPVTGALGILNYTSDSSHYIFTKKSGGKIIAEITLPAIGITSTGSFSPVIKREIYVTLFEKGSGTQADNYQIRNVAELLSLSIVTNSGRVPVGAYYKLVPDSATQLAGAYDLSGIPNWSSIGTQSSPFSGYFSGENCTVRGLLQNITVNSGITTSQQTFTGLFGNVTGGKIEKLVLNNFDIDANLNISVPGNSVQFGVGALASRINNTVIANITTSDISIVVTDSQSSSFDKGIGGLVGISLGTGSKVSSCFVSNTVITGNIANSTSTRRDDKGGIVGRITGNTSTTFTSLAATGITITENTNSASDYTLVSMGGILGRNVGSVPLSSLTVTNGTLTGNHSTIGGICGHATGSITNCGANDIHISGGGRLVGGIVGVKYTGSGSISDCFATGQIENSSTETGGIAGYTDQPITDCYFNGTVYGHGAMVGGIAGQASSSSASILNSFAEGTIKSDIGTMGGIVGKSLAQINLCGFYGKLTNYYITNSGSIYTGGIVGNTTGSMSSCFAICSIGAPAIHGGDIYVGGLAGYTTNSISTSYFAGRMAFPGVTDYGAGINYFGPVTGFGGTALNCYYDDSLSAIAYKTSIVGTVSSKTIFDLTKNADPGSLGSDWIFSSGLYPRLKKMVSSTDGTGIGGTAESTYTGTLSASVSSKAFISAVPVYMVPAQDGEASLTVRYPGAEFDPTSISGDASAVLLLYSETRVTAKENGSASTVNIVDIAYKSSTLSKSIEFTPSVEPVGKGDISWLVDALRTGNTTDGVTKDSGQNVVDHNFTIYSADQLNGLRYIIEDISGDGNGCPIVEAKAVLGQNNRLSGITIHLAHDISLDFTYLGSKPYAEWNPIGNLSRDVSGKSYCFGGVFDGSLHIISGLTVPASSSKLASGLFEAIAGSNTNSWARIKNLGLTGINIASLKDSTAISGAFAGIADKYSAIENSFASGMVTANSVTAASYGGGLVGQTSGDTVSPNTIINSYFTGTVLSNTATLNSANPASAGGFSGSASETVFENCYVASLPLASTNVSGMTKYSGSMTGISTESVSAQSTYYDKQMSGLLPAAGNGVISGYTSLMTASLATIDTGYRPAALSGGFSDTSTWKYTGGLYPMLNGFTESIPVIISAVPVTITANALTASTGVLSDAEILQGATLEIPNSSLQPNGYEGAVELSEDSRSFVKLSTGKLLINIVMGTEGNACRRPFVINIKCWFDDVQEGGVYIISSANELAEFAAIVNGTVSAFNPTGTHEHETPLPDGKYNFAGKTVKLGRDIDLASFTPGAVINGHTYWSGWTPIGTDANPFAGNFDGNGHVVKNLTVQTLEDDATTTPQKVQLTYAGLFGKVDGATIRNVGLTGGSVTASAKDQNSVVGSVVAKANDSTIENCFNYTPVSLDTAETEEFNYYLGGIVGLAASSTITRCFNSAALSSNRTGVDGAIYIGGISGSLSDGSHLSDCYNTGPLSGSGLGTGAFPSYVGGIVGSAGSCLVETSYNAAVIFSTENSGAIYSDGTTAPLNCYYSDRLYAPQAPIGQPTCNPAHGTGVPTPTLTSSSGTEGFDGDIWLHQNGVYPQLKVFTDSNASETFKISSGISAMILSFTNGADYDATYNKFVKATISRSIYDGAPMYAQLIAGPGSETAVLITAIGNYYSISPVSDIDGFLTLNLSANIGSDISILRQLKMQSQDPKGINYVLDLSSLRNGLKPTPVPLSNMGNPIATQNWISNNSGDGSRLSPYVIQSPNDMLAFANFINGGGVTLNKYFLLTEYLDMSSMPLPSIGTSSNPFEGEFNGNMKVISNLTMSKSGRCALFDYIGSYGKIMNLGIETSSFTATTASGEDVNVGSIAVSNLGRINNCFSNSVLLEAQAPGSGKYTYFGGLAAKNSGSITGCYYNIGSISTVYHSAIAGMAYVGGIAGENSGILNGCYSSIAYTNTNGYFGNRIAGLSSGQVRNCYYNNQNASGRIGYTDTNGVNNTSGDLTPDELMCTGKTSVEKTNWLLATLCENTYGASMVFSGEPSLNNGFPVLGAFESAKYNYKGFTDESVFAISVRNLSEGTGTTMNALCSVSKYYFPVFNDQFFLTSLGFSIFDLPRILSYDVTAVQETEDGVFESADIVKDTVFGQFTVDPARLSAGAQKIIFKVTFSDTATVSRWGINRKWVS